MSYFGKEIKKLGFGMMRLPMMEDGETTDIGQVKQMVDRFMEAGCTYFDTAYVYGKGWSTGSWRLAAPTSTPLTSTGKTVSRKRRCVPRWKTKTE